MSRGYEQNQEECRINQNLLSEYVDGSLSARTTWEVEKHLSDCSACSSQASQLRELVNLLHNTETKDTSDEFMRNLYARLDSLPQPERNLSFNVTMKDILASAGTLIWKKRVPALGAGFAVVGLTALFFAIQIHINDAPNDTYKQTITPNIQQALERNVAAAAADPLGDLAAERLASQPQNNSSE